MDKIDLEHTMNGEFEKVDTISGPGVWKFVSIYDDGYENVECMENENDSDTSAEELEYHLRNKEDIKDLRIYKQVEFYD